MKRHLNAAKVLSAFASAMLFIGIGGCSSDGAPSANDIKSAFLVIVEERGSVRDLKDFKAVKITVNHCEIDDDLDYICQFTTKLKGHPEEKLTGAFRKQGKKWEMLGAF